MRWLARMRLKSKSAQSRLKGVQTLAVQCDASASLLLWSVLDGETDTSVRKAIINALGRAEVEDAHHLLLRKLRSDFLSPYVGPSYRWRESDSEAIIAVLCSSMGTQCVRPFIELATDMEPLLQKYPSHRATSALLRDALIGAAIGLSGSHREQIVAIFDHPRPDVVATAVRIVGEAGDAALVERMIELSRGLDHAPLSRAAIQVLGRIRHDRATQELLVLLESPCFYRRAAAAEAIGGANATLEVVNSLINAASKERQRGKDRSHIVEHFIARSLAHLSDEFAGIDDVGPMLDFIEHQPYHDIADYSKYLGLCLNGADCDGLEEPLLVHMLFRSVSAKLRRCKDILPLGTLWRIVELADEGHGYLDMDHEGYVRREIEYSFSQILSSAAEAKSIVLDELSRR